MTILTRLARLRYLSHWVILFADVALSTLATLTTIQLVVLLAHIDLTYLLAAKMLLVSVTCSTLSFVAMRTYRVVVRHTTLKELWVIGVAVLIKAALITSMAFAVYPFEPKIITIIFLFELLITLFLLIAARIFAIIVYDMVKYKVNHNHNKANALVYGIDNKSVSLAKRVMNSDTYSLVGYYKFGESYKSYRLANTQVFYFRNFEDFEYIINKYDVNAIIFANYKSMQEEKDRLIQYCTNGGVKVYITPDASEMDSLKPLKGSIREIKIEDLLGRDEININMDAITENFKAKTILVTGAAGSIGSELCRQLTGFNIKKLVMFDSAETPMHNIRLELEEQYHDLDFVPVIGDVRDKDRLKFVFEKYKPQVVFHAAAYKHVPLMEENPCEAIAVNVQGTRNVADMAVNFGVEKMIMISTDKAVNPTNVMGASKRLAEMYVQSLGIAIENGDVAGNTKFITTRFGNVLGSNGSVIPRFREQIEKGGPVTVTHPDITRFFMTIPEACRLVMEAATMGGGNDIFVFEMGESVKILTLAERMIELAGYKPNVDIKILFTGLRPGEKLYEEVLCNSENTIPTKHQKILRAKVRNIDYADISVAMEKLQQEAIAVHIDDMVRIMKDIVPEFISNNSRFEHLDAVKHISASDVVVNDTMRPDASLRADSRLS